MPAPRRCAVVLLLVLGAIFLAPPARHAARAQEPKKQKVVAGKADVMHRLPKKFATLVGVDVDRRQVQLHVEGEEQARTWDVADDAELKYRGWWGRLGQFAPGERVWVWLAVDRQAKPVRVLMLADELSQQDIHRLPPTLKSRDAENNAIVIESPLGRRTLSLGEEADAAGPVGEHVYVQSAGDAARVVASQEQFEALRAEQRDWLRERWRQEGLPGAVAILHPLSGEMELLLDHEAKRWGRYLRNGDAVTIKADGDVKAVVKYVRPWRERTVLGLVTSSGLDQTELGPGQRVRLLVPEPPAEVQQSDLPTDIGRAKSKPERIEWFLASVYCPCKVAKDRCTGMFYTLSSCNVNACGMPNAMRRQLAELIDQGKTDEQIWRELEKTRGPQVHHPHLLH